MIRSPPSRTWVSLSTAWWLSWALALVIAFQTLGVRLGSSSGAEPGERSPSTSRWAYQTAIIGHGRQLPHRLPVGADRPSARSGSAAWREYPFSRPAISMLAARRLTSHSQGPGAVSSKSLTSKIRWRSGEPKIPKLERWASPHSWTSIPEVGVVARSAAIGSAAPRK